MRQKTTAIVLAGGQGKRMQSKVQKQYLLLKEKPILYYSLHTFSESFVDDIVLVVGKGEVDSCQRNIIEKYHITKVRAVVEGGKERYHSVKKGMEAISWDCDYVFIHDAARPFLTQTILERVMKQVTQYGACVVGMPVKDTVKIADSRGYVDATPDRSRIWQIQTPQVFEYKMIQECYRKLMEQEAVLLGQGVTITDDAMVVERFADTSVKLVEGSYQNIKITTPEDLEIGEVFIKNE